MKHAPLFLIAVIALFSGYSARANTEVDLTNGQTNLTAGASYTGTPTLTTSSDITFTALGGSAYSPTALTVPANLSIGTINDLNSAALTIGNPSTTTAFTLTLNGGSDSVSGSATSDLIYVANSGSLTIQNVSGAGTKTLALALAHDGNFDVGSSGTLTISDILSGNFNLTKTGNGTLLLSGANTFGASKIFTISAGTVQLGAATLSLGVASDAVSVSSGADLDLNGKAFTTANALTINGQFSSTVGAVTNGSATAGSYAGTVAMASNSSIGGSNGTITLSGVVSGNFNLTKVGSDTLILSNVANTFGSGTTTFTIGAGTVQLGAATTSLGVAANSVSVTSGAVLDLNGKVYTTANALTINGTGIASGGALTNSNATAGSYAGTVTLGSDSSIGGANAITLNGVVSGAFNLTKIGAGTLTFGNVVNTFGAGKTFTISAGTVLLGNAGSLGDATDAVSETSGAVLDLNGQAVANTNALTINGTGIASGGALTNSNATAGSYAGTVTLGSDSSIGGANAITLNGVVSGAFNLTKIGAGTLTFGNVTNTFGAGKTFTISAGTVLLDNAASLGSSAVGLSGGTLDLATDTTVNASNVTVTGSTTIASDKATAGTGGITQTLGTLSIGANTLNITAGANVTGGSPVVAFGATTLSGTTGVSTTLNPTTAALTLTTVTSLAASGKTDTLDLDGTSTGNTVTGVISNGATGTVALTKTNSSTWTLGGVNTYTGSTTDSGGTLTITGTLGNTAVTVGAATLNLNNASAISQNTLTVNNAASVVTESATNALSGSAALTESAGSVTLSTANNFTGATTLSGGTLTLSIAGAITGSAVTVTGGTLTESADNALSGATSLAVKGTTQTLANSNNYTGTTTIGGSSAVTSVLNATETGSGSPLGTGSIALTNGTLNFAPGTGASGAVAFSGGDVAAARTITYSAANGGINTISLNKGSASSLTYTFNSNTAASLVLTTPGVLVFTTNSADLNSGENVVFSTTPTLVNNVLPTSIIGLGVATTGMADFLTVNGSKQLVTAAYTTRTGNIAAATTASTEFSNVSANADFQGNNTASGLLVQNGVTATIDSGKTLSVGPNNANPAGVILNGGNISGGNLTFLTSVGGFIYDYNAPSTISSIVTGTAGLTVAGNQTLTMTGPVNITGAATVLSGGLTLTGEANSALVFTVNGGTLNLDAPYLATANTLTVGGNITSGLTESVANAITGSTALTVSGGTATLSQANNYLGATTVSGGTLNLTAGGAIGGGSAVTVSGGILNVSGTNAMTGTDSLSLTGGGTGVVNITGSENYTGKTSIASPSILNISGAGSLTSTNISFGSNASTAILSLQTANAITGTSTLTLAGGGISETADDAISGGVSVTLGNYNSTISRANNYTGATTIYGGGNPITVNGIGSLNGSALDFSQALSPVSNIINNGISHASIGTGSTLVLYGGSLYIVGKNATANTQEFNGLTLNVGPSTLVADAGSGGGTMSVALNAITRNVGGTVNFSTNAGGSITTTTTNTDYTGIGGSNSIIGGWATDGGSWATVNPVSGVISALASGSYTTVSNSPTLAGDIEAGGKPGGVGTTVSVINSLRFNTVGVGDITLHSGGSTVIASGGILVSQAATTNDIIEGGSDTPNQASGTLTSGNGQDLDVIVNGSSTLDLGASVTDNGVTSIGLTSTGALNLDNANTFTGQLTIGSGTVKLNHLNALGGNPFVMLGLSGVNMGTLNLNGFSATISGLADDVTGIRAGGGVNGGDLVTSATAATLTINQNSNTTYNGSITGALGLTKGGTGTLTLTGAINNNNDTTSASYTGATIINGGKLYITSANVNVSGTTSIAVGSAGSIGGGNSVKIGSTTATTGITVAGGGAIDQTDGTTNQTLTMQTIAADTFTYGDSSGTRANLDLDLGAALSDRLTISSVLSVGSSGIQVNLVGLANNPLTGGTPTILSATSLAGSITTFVGNVGANGSGKAVTLGTTTGDFNGYTVALVGGATSVTLSETANTTPTTAFFSGAQGNAWNFFTGGNANNSDWVSTDGGSTDTLQQPASTTNVNFGTAPSSGTPLANYLNNVLGANYTINSLTFDSTAASNAITISGNNTLTIGGAAGITDSATGGTQTIATNLVTLGASQTWTVTNAADTLAVSAGITDNANSFSLTKAGAGTLLLTGVGTYFGGTVINAGTVQVGNGGTTGNLGNGGVSGTGGTLAYDRTDSYTENNAISGGVAVSQIGSGSTAFTSNNSYSGGTTITTGTVYANNATSSTGTGAISVANTATLGGNGKIAPTGTNGITVASGGSVTPGGVQTNVGTFSAYTGVPTNVVNGKLSIDTTNITSSSTILAASQGSGLTFAIGAGTPGAGSSTSVSQLLVTGSKANIMNFNIGGTAGSGGTSTVVSINDLIGDAMTLGTSAGTEYVLIQGNGNTIYEDNGVQLGTGLAAGDLGTSGALGQQILGGLSLLSLPNNNYFSNSYGQSELFLQGDNLVLAAIPEPGTWALMLGGLGLLVFFQRRKRIQS